MYQGQNSNSKTMFLRLGERVTSMFKKLFSQGKEDSFIYCVCTLLLEPAPVGTALLSVVNSLYSKASLLPCRPL